jgi:hypothetical protein
MRTRHSIHPVQALAGLLLASALALAGCSSGANDTSASDAGGGAKAAAPDTAQQEGASGSGNARNTKSVPKLTAGSIIRTASLSVRVKDVPKALDEARTTTENAGGFVGNETTTRDGQGHERTRVVLRVPTDKYDEVLADLEGAGKLLDRTAKAQDVTDQVVDVESRIASQRASVARVRELMDRATKLSDVVELEGELSTRESDLEALLAQQASLKDRTGRQGRREGRQPRLRGRRGGRLARLRDDAALDRAGPRRGAAVRRRGRAGGRRVAASRTAASDRDRSRGLRSERSAGGGRTGLKSSAPVACSHGHEPCEWYPGTTGRHRR